MGGLNSGPGPGITLLIAIVVVLTQTALAAPVHEDEEAQESNSHALAESHGCYYNFQHYNEGERILTNEPCLNCTCRNRMLMCYLRVCPFTKGIGQNCTVEKVPGQCCPIITCPEVPVQLLTSTTTEHSEGGKGPSHYYGNKGTAVGHLDTNGCNIDGIFYPNGAQVPGSPEKPCELCYCIRNKTACIMQECALHVDGCRPVYEEGQCFPVRYQCDDSPYEEEQTTTIRPAPTPGLIITTTSSEPLECSYNNDIYEDGSRIPTEDPCEHCYCLKGKIACAVQECGAPLEKDGQNCTALPPAPGKCCPDSYQCDNNVIVHAKENFVRKDRKQKFEPKPIEHNDITMTSQGLSSGSEVTTQSGVVSVADAGHPTDSYHPDKVTTEKPKLTTNRFDEESRVTEGVTPTKGIIAKPSVTPEHQQELDKGTQKEKDSRPVKPIGDQKITFPDEFQAMKGEATSSPVDHTDAQIIHMSPEKQPDPEIESHKQGVTPQIATNDVLLESSTPHVKDPLIDKLHNIIQDVQSQVGDGKTSQIPEEVDIQTTTQSQKGHFTEKPDVLSHLPHSSTPGTEITNTTKESSPENTNILNQIQGIIQGIYSHVTDSIMSTKQPESSTEIGQLPGQQPSVSEKEGIAGSYPGKHPEGGKHPEYPPGMTGRPKRPTGTDFPEGATEFPDTKTPQKVGSNEQSYGTQFPDEIGATGRPEGTTKLPETAHGTRYPEKPGGRPKDPSLYPTGQYPESLEVPGKPSDPSKYPESLKPHHHLSGISGRPDDQAKNPEGVTEEYPVDSKYPQGYKPGEYPDGSKFPEEVTGKPVEHTTYPDAKYPDSVKPSAHYPESSGVTGKPQDFSKYPSGQYSEVVGPTGQNPEKKPTSEDAEFTGITGEPQYHSKYPDGVTGQYPLNANDTGFRPTGKYPESGKPHDQSQYSEGNKPSEKYPDRHKPIGEHPESVTRKPENQTNFSVKPTGHYPSDSKYPEGVHPPGQQSESKPAEEYLGKVTEQPHDKNKLPVDKYPESSKYPAKPEDTLYGTEYPDITGTHVTKYPEDGYQTKYPEAGMDPSKNTQGQYFDSKPVGQIDSTRPAGQSPSEHYPEVVTEKPKDSTGYSETYSTDYPKVVSGKPSYPEKIKPQKYPGAKPTEKYPDDSKFPERVTEQSEGTTKSQDSYGAEYTENVSGRPKDPTKSPDGVQLSETNPEKFKPIPSYPNNLADKPDHQTKFPPSEHYTEHAQSSTPKYSHGSTPTSEDEAVNTENPEGVTGKPIYDKYPTRPGYPSHPVQLPQGTEYPEGEASTEQYPDDVNSRPQENTRYPTQRPGVFRPTGEYPDDPKAPEGVTGQPEDSTKYPYGHGTEYPEGVSGRPKDPTKYPEVGRPDDGYPKHPEGVTGRPEDHTPYPSQRPGVFRPTGEYPDGSKRPVGVTGQPEDSTKYPHGHGTEYPEGVSGRPKDPSKYPEGVRPGDRYPDGSKHPEYLEGVTGRPEDHTRYPSQRPGVFRPTGEYPDGSKRPEGVTGQPEDSTKYPYGHGTEYPEGVSGRPKDPSKYPEGVRPGDRYPDGSKHPEYPEGVTGRPEDHTRYPNQRPGVFRPTGEYPDGPKRPEAVTGQPEDSTKYPYGHGTEYPEGVSGRPKDPSKYPGGVRPSDRYPDGSKHPEYPEGVTGRPEGTTFYPGGDEAYGTEYPEENVRPKDPSIYPGARPTGVTGRPGESTKYPDGVRPGFSPTEKYPHKPEGETEYSGPGGTAKPEDAYVEKMKPTGQYPFDSKYPGGISVRPSDTTELPEGSRPTGHFIGEGTGRPSDVTPSGQSSNDLESFNQQPDGVSKRPVNQTKYPQGSYDQYPIDSKYPVGNRPGDDFMSPDIQDHTKYPFDSKHPQKPEDNIYGTEHPDTTGKPESGTKETGNAPGKYPGKPISSEYPSSAKPGRPHTRPGVQDETFGTEYPETTESEYESEYGTEYPELGTKYPMLTNYPTRRPIAGDNLQQIPGTENETGTDHLGGSPIRPGSGSYLSATKRPGLKPGDTSESVTDSTEGLKPSSAGHYPSGPDSAGHQDKKPEDDSYGTEYPEADLNTERPHYTSKYPEKPSAEDQLLVTERPDSKVTFHLDGAKHPSESKVPTGDIKYPSETSTKIPYYTSQPPPRPGHPEDSKLPTKDTIYGTEYPVGSATSKYPAESKLPNRPKPAVEDGSKYPNLEDKNKDSESVTGKPSSYPSKPEDEPHDTEPPNSNQAKYPASVKPGDEISYKPEYGTEYPEEEITEYPKVKPQHPSKYPEGSEPSVDKIGAETPEHGTDPHGTSKPLDQSSGTQYPEGVTKQPEFTQHSKQPDQTPTKESSPSESTNILNQIQGIIQGIYSQVTDSIMSTIRPESMTVDGQDGSKPEEGDRYSHPGPTGIKQPSSTEFPDGVKFPQHLQGVTGRPQIPNQNSETDNKYPEGVAGYPDKIRPTETPGASTKNPQNVGSNEETYPTQYPDQTGQTGRPEGSTEFTDGDRVHVTEYPQVSGKPKEPTKFPQKAKPGQHIQGFKPTEPNQDRFTGRPYAETKFPDGVTEYHPVDSKHPQESKPGELTEGPKYPEGFSGKPEDHTKYPEGITGYYPDASKYPESTGGTIKTPVNKYPEVQSSGEYPDGVTGRPEDQTKDSEEVRPTEQYPIDSKYPEGSRPTESYPHESGKPHYQNKYPDSQLSSNSKDPTKLEDILHGTKYPEGKPEYTTKYPEGYGTEYPGVSDQPKGSSKYPGEVRPSDRYPEHPEGVTGRPEDHTRYPSQRPGVFRPTGEYPDDPKAPEGVTGQPEDSTKYPYGHGTEYPEGVSGRPKDPTKYPEVGRPDDHTRYPSQRPGVFRPTGGYPDDSKHPEGVTGQPEDSTKYPYGHGTEYPEGVSGRPKDPSKYPEGVRPGDRYPDGSKHPEYPEGVTGRPDDHTRYPSQRPGIFRPTGGYPDDSKRPEGVTGQPEDSTKYPYGHGTEYPEGVSGRPKDPTKYPEVARPGDRYPDGSKHPEYPEGVTGRPEGTTFYPGGDEAYGTEYEKFKPGQQTHDSKPTGQGDSKHPSKIPGKPEGVQPEKYPERITGRPEYSTEYPEGEKYPGVTGSPKDPSKYPEIVKPHHSRPTGSPYGTEYPDATGRPDGTDDFATTSKHPQKPEISEIYVTDSSGAATHRPGLYPVVSKRPVSRPKPSTEFPEQSTEQPEQYPQSTDYPTKDEMPFGKPKPVTENLNEVSGTPVSSSKYSSRPKPEYEKPYGTEYPETTAQEHAVNRPQKPSTYPHDGVHSTGYPEKESVTSDKYPQSGKPTYEDEAVNTENPEGVTGKPIYDKHPTRPGYPSRPVEYPDDSKHPEGVTGQPEDSTKYPYGHGTEYPEGVSGRPKDPSKYPEGVRPGDRYPDGSKHPEYPEGVTGRPEDHTRYPSQRPGVFRPTGEYPDGSKRPEGVTGQPEDSTKYPYGHGTEYPEGVSGRPKDPTKYPEVGRPDDGYPEHPEGVTGRPEDHTRYPNQRPGVFRPTGEYPDGPKRPEAVTGQPEDSTKYPYGHGTEYPEGVSGRPKDPSKYPGGVRPSDRYPDGSKYPEYPEGVTGRPEGTTFYPGGDEAYGTEYPGENVRPKDPSIYPGARPTGVTGRPGESTKYPDGVRPGFSPTEKYPHKPEGETEYSGPGGTAKPEDAYVEKMKPTGQYPFDSKYPGGISVRPSDTTELPEGSRPTGHFIGEGTGRPEYQTKYPEWVKPDEEYPEAVNATGLYPTDSKHPDVVKPIQQHPEGVSPTGQYPEDFKPEEVTMAPGSKFPDKVSVRPEDGTKYSEGAKPTVGYSDEYEPTENISFDVTGKPDGLTKHPQRVKPSDKYPPVFTPSDEDSEDFKPTEKYSETSSQFGKPEDQTKHPGTKPSEQYPQGSKYPPELGYGSEHPESSTKISEEYGTEYPEGVSKKPKEPTKYPAGVQVSEGLKPTEQYPEGVEPEESKPAKQSSDSKYPESVTGKPEDQTKYPHVITGRPEGPTHYPEGDSHVTEFSSVKGRPKDPSKQPEGIHSGLYPAELKPSEQYPERITSKPDEHVKHPDEVKPGGHYPDGSEYPEASGVTGKPHEFNKYPEVKPTEQYEIDSKHPEGSKPSEQTPEDYVSKPGFKPTEKYPHEITGKPEDQTKYPDDFASQPENAKPYLEEDYGTEYPGVSSRPKDPSKYPEGLRPEKYPDGSKQTPDHPGLVTTEKYPHGVTGKPEDHTKYSEGARPSEQHSEGFKPEDKDSQKPDDEYSQSATGQYPGTTSPPHYSTKYPIESKPLDNEGMTDRPVYQTDYPEGVKPTKEYSEEFKPTGKYPVDSEHSASTTEKTEEAPKYPEGLKPSEPYPNGSKPTDPKNPGENPEENIKPSVKYPDRPKHPGGITGKPQDYTKYPEGDATEKPYGSSKHPYDVTEKPEDKTNYPEGVTEHYPVGSKHPEQIKPSGQYPESSEATGKPHGVSKYPEGQYPEDSKHPGSKYPEFSKPPTEYPYGQEPSEKYPDLVTGKPEKVTNYSEGVSEITEYPEATGRPKEPSKYPEKIKPEQFPEGLEPSGQYPVDTKYPVDVTKKPEDVSKYPEHHTKYYPAGMTSRPDDHTKHPESVKPGQRPQQPENEFLTESQAASTGRPEYQTEYPEGFTGQYLGVSGRPQDGTKYPEDGAEVTHTPDGHYSAASKRPTRPDVHITFLDSTKPSEQNLEDSKPFEKQPELSPNEQYPEGVTDDTEYPGARPGEHQAEGSKYPERPGSTSDNTEYPEVTGKYPEPFGTEYPDGSKATVQTGSKYPEGTTEKPTKRPVLKPGLTTILPMDFETGVVDLIEYTKKPKPEKPSEADAATTVWPIHKHPVKHPQRPDGLGDESFGTEYPETTESDFEYYTVRPDVTAKYPDDSKPGVSRPKPDIEYLPQGGEKPSSQTHGLDENFLPSKETQTDRTPIAGSVDGLKPSVVDDYSSRPRPTIPGEGLYNKDVTQKPLGQTTSGTGVHPTVELTPDIKIPEGDLVAGKPEKYPSTEQPLESLSSKPVDGAIGQQIGTNRHPETTSDDDLINKLHNIISGIQSQTNVPEQSTFSPESVGEIGRPASTRGPEIHTSTKGSFVTDRPQEGPGFAPTGEDAQHSDSSKPLSGQSSSTEDPKASSEKYPEPIESDKTKPHSPTESTFHTVTPQDEVQKQTSTDKPLHVVYPTYYPDGVVTRKPGAKPDDGDKKVTVTPQSTQEKLPEQGETHTVYDVQTEISSETATTPGVVIVQEVHTEVHSERPTKRPIFGPAITQPGSSDLTTYSGHQTEIPETTKPSYVTVTPIGTISESDHIMNLYSTKEKHPATDTPTTQSFVTEPTVQQHTRFPSRKTTQTPIDELTTHKPQGTSYVPYKLVNSTKVYYPEKEQSQKPFETGPYDGYDQIPYEVVNGTKFFYPNRVATEQPTTSASLGMYVPYKIINGTKVYYTQDPPHEPEKYDGLDYVPFEIINGTKVFYPEKVSTTPSPTTAMYVPFKIVNGNKVYYPKDAKDEPQDVPDEYDGFDYVPFETVNGKKVFHPERVPNHTPAGSDYVPYKLMNNTKIYYPKDAQNEQENIPKGYDGVDSVPYDIIENEKVYYPEKASPQKSSAMFVPYKLVNGTKVYYPKHGQDKPTQPPEGYDGFDYIPYDTVNGTKVFHPERITPKPAYYPNKMFVPFKIVNNTKVFYPKDAQNKPRPLKPEYDGVEYLPYNVVNGTKVFNPPVAPTAAMYVPYVIRNGEKVYDLKKATDDPKGVPEGYDGIDYLPYEVKDGGMVFYPEKTAAPKPKEGSMYVPYKLINGTKIYYADKATDQPENVPEEYDGFDYLPYELQNGNKIFYPDRVATTTPITPKEAMYVPYKLINGKKVYETDKASENPQDIPEEFDGFDYVPYDIKNGNKVFYPEQVASAPKEGAMYVPYKLINGTKVYYADKATDQPENIPKEYDGFDYIPYKLQNGNKIFYPDKTATSTTPVTPKQGMYVPYKLIDGKKVYQTDKATENPQDVPEEFDGFDYVPYDIKNGNKVFYPERVKPTPKEGAMYVPYKLNNATKVYYADKATDKPEDVSEDFDGFDYIPYELQNGNKLFYPDRVATPTSKKAMYVPYKLDNGKKIYQTDKATDNPQGIPGKFDGFDYVPYDIKNGNKVFYPEKVIPTKGSEYVPYKIVKGMKVYHPEKAADEAQEIPEEFDGFDYLPFETQNGNKIFYPDRVTQPPKGAIYVPYKLVNGKKVYNPNKATNNPQDIPKGYDGCDYIPYEIKNGNKVFHPEQITTPAPTKGSMYVPYKLINGTKVYYADKATDKEENVPAEYDGLDYLPYELQNGNKIFYPERATTPAPNKLFKYIPYKLVNGRKVYYPDRAADTPEDIPKGYDGFDYLPIEYTTKPQESQGMFVPYKTINGTKVYYPQEAHKRPHPLSDEYSGLDYMPYETINGTKVFYPEREPQAMYVPYKIINGSKVFYPKDAQPTAEEIPPGYDGLDYVPYDIVNGSQIFHPDRVPEYQGMFVPYKIVNGKKVFYPKYAQHKPMVMDGYDGFDYLPYENVNGTKVFKPEIPEQAMYVPYKIINGTKVYYPKFAQRKPEVPVGYDGSDYIPYQLVNGTKIFDPSIKPAMYVPYKIMDGTKVYYPKHAQHKPELIPSGYDGHDYLPYEVINGNKVFKPGQATSQEQMTPQIKQAMYVPYKIVNGTKVYYPKYAQNNPYLIPAGYDGFDYIPYEIVNGTKVFHPEQATTAPSPPKQAMYVPYKLANGTKAYYPKHAQHTPTPVPFNYDGLDYLPYEVVNGTKIFEPQPHTKPTYLEGMFVPYKLSNNTKIFYPKDAHNKPHYVPQGYDGADYVPYEAVNNSKLFYPELISMAQPNTANIPGIYVPFRLVNNKKVFYPKEATPFPPTVRYPYDGVAFVPYKSSASSEIIYVDEDDLTKPHTLSGHVPGEGNCYLNNRTYGNNTEIAPVSPCQARCTCISSVVRCVRVKCPPPPQNKLDCSPVYREGTCCPTYTCGESENDYPTTVGYPETKAPEGTSHGHDSESTTAFTDLTLPKRPGSGEEGKPGQQSEEYHLHKPPKPSEHESLEPYDSVEGQLSPEEDYDVEDEEPYGPGTCRYAGKVYVSAQQIPRDDPCDFCFCFRSDIICLQQSCPPPIPGCRDEPIEGFCCPRYECHVKMATLLNVTSTTTTTTTTLPPHFFPHAYKGSATRTGCFVQGKAYRVGQPIPSASGPCMDCICGGNGRMKCEPKVCTPEPMIRKMMSPSESTTTSTNER